MTDFLERYHILLLVIWGIVAEWQGATLRGLMFLTGMVAYVGIFVFLSRQPLPPQHRCTTDQEVRQRDEE